MIVATIGHVARAWLLLAPHNSYGHSDISGLSLLASTVATDYLTSMVRCYWTASSDGLSDISDPSLLDCTIATA
jgi:hypothetical protein